jgi:hypothetical protein
MKAQGLTRENGQDHPARFSDYYRPAGRPPERMEWSESIPEVYHIY